jgi:hypothetical protein
MDEVLNMGMKDRDRLCVIRNTLSRKITQIAAAEILRLSLRQVQRVCAAVRRHGDGGILHGLRGQPSNHRFDEELLGQALSALHDPLWEGFGPVFAREKLEELHGIVLGKTTVRSLMLVTNLWEVHRHRSRHRAWRERRRCVGMLIQLDGSPHDWFEGRGPWCTLLIYIDDATSRVLYGEFVDEEATVSLMRASKVYLKLWGRPAALYVDRDSIYSVNRPANVEEQLSGKDPVTQFTRAMRELGIGVILAGSPQAKGRVERGFLTHQDRLVKELRLAGISTMEAANKFLREVYIPKHNRRYAVEPAEPADMHKPLLSSHDLDAILSIQEGRQVYNDSIVRYENRLLLLAEGHGLRPKTKVIVQERLDGTLRIVRQGRYFKFTEVQARPYVPEQLRRSKPKPVLPPTIPRLPRNPFFGGTSIRSGEPTNAPASALL